MRRYAMVATPSGYGYYIVCRDTETGGLLPPGDVVGLWDRGALAPSLLHGGILVSDVDTTPRRLAIRIMFTITDDEDPLDPHLSAQMRAGT